MFVVICDAQQKILRTNPEFLAAVGLAPEEVLGRPVSRFLVTEGGTLDLGVPLPERARLRIRDGAELAVALRETELAQAGARERMLVGEPLPVQALGLETLPGWQCLDNIEGAVLTEDSRGVITFANARLLGLLGFAATELKGRHWTEIVPAEERPDVASQLDSRPRGTASQYETAILSKSGTRIPVIVSARPVFQSGRYQGTVSTFTDITERKKAEDEIRSHSERLEALNRALELERRKLVDLTEKLQLANETLQRLSEAKSDFVAAVSHDLRTPLTTIMEGIRLTEDGALGQVNEKQQRFLHCAWEEARRLSELINDLLDLARIERGKSVPQRTRVDLAAQVLEVRRTFESYVRERNLELVLLPTAPGLLADCDASHYRRVLTNLLSNAVKFTPAGGTITIRVEPIPGGMIQTSVRDTGIGIPRSQHGRLFGEFEQIRRPGAELETGTGLGLALCRQLTELNGGTINFESEEGRGSTFYFSLPAASAAPVPEETPRQIRARTGLT